MQGVFEKLLAKWETESGGIQISEQRRLTNLRFADDVLLVACDAESLKGMLEDLADKAAQVGLELHYGKTNVLCNRPAREKSSGQK